MTEPTPEQIEALADKVLQKASESPLLGQLLESAFVAGAQWRDRNPNADINEFIRRDKVKRRNSND